MLVNENTAVHCLFMLVHSALTNFNKHNLWPFISKCWNEYEL